MVEPLIRLGHLQKQKIYKNFCRKVSKNAVSCEGKIPLIRPDNLPVCSLDVWQSPYPAIQGPFLACAFSTYPKGNNRGAQRPLQLPRKKQLKGVDRIGEERSP